MADSLGTFEQMVLLAVVRSGDGAYGRAVLRDVQVVVEREVAAGAIYATLDRLEQKGLLASRIEEGTEARGGRARRYYRLTAAGIAALNDSRSLLEQMWRGTEWPLGELA